MLPNEWKLPFKSFEDLIRMLQHICSRMIVIHPAFPANRTRAFSAPFRGFEIEVPQRLRKVSNRWVDKPLQEAARQVMILSVSLAAIRHDVILNFLVGREYLTRIRGLSGEKIREL